MNAVLNSILINDSDSRNIYLNENWNKKFLHTEAAH